jgi:carboxyl-terminal processing protease
MSYKDWTRLSLIALLVLAIAMVSGGAGFAAGWLVRPHVVASPTPPAHTEVQEEFGIFWEAWDIIDREFNREGPLDTKVMTYGAISGMIRSLGDPHTVFVEPAQARIFSEDLEGSFEGIGATVDMVEGNLVIVEPLQDSPAAQAGLLPGDIVLEADGQSLQGMQLLDAIILIRGPKGSQVRLLIRRAGVPEPFEVTITRQRIDLPTVSYQMRDDGIAYVRLTEFNNQANVRLQAALGQVLAQEPRAMILDLRSNPGGYLHIAVQVSSQFVREGVIVSERDAKGKTTEYKADGQGMALDIPLVVLIDGGTASAAEIVAGAIQDSGRGVLIGRRTYGKGSVQASHPLSDGSSVRVSIARWRTPSGRQLDREGLLPDILVLPDTTAPADGDPILERAVEYLARPQPVPEARA